MTGATKAEITAQERKAMGVTENAIAQALLDWMRGKERVTAAAAEEFAVAAVAGVKKITLEFGTPRSVSCEEQGVPVQE